MSEFHDFIRIVYDDDYGDPSATLMVANGDVCPTCGSHFDRSVAALSRRDNKTEICSRCGTIEGITDAALAKRNEKKEDEYWETYANHQYDEVDFGDEDEEKEDEYWETYANHQYDEVDFGDEDEEKE
jgi:hypothetical protein